MRSSKNLKKRNVRRAAAMKHSVTSTLAIPAAEEMDSDDMHEEGVYTDEEEESSTKDEAAGVDQDFDDEEEVGDEEEEEDESSDDEEEYVRQLQERRQNLCTPEHRGYPPTLEFEFSMLDLDFHPSGDVVALAGVDGQSFLYKYAVGGNEEIYAKRNHDKGSCRSVVFSTDGSGFYTGGADGKIHMIDTETQAIVHTREAAHSSPITVVRNRRDVVASGDDSGGIKLWDIRQKKCIYEYAEHEEYISDMLLLPGKNELITTSGDGHLGVFHMRKGGLVAMSDHMDDELLCLCAIKGKSKVVCGTSTGVVDIFNWGWWGDMSDRMLGHPCSVDTMVYIDDLTVATAGEDGIIRLISFFPNKVIGMIGSHDDQPVQSMKRSHDGVYLGTTGHDNRVRFFNVASLNEADSDEEEEDDEKKEEEHDKEAASKVLVKRKPAPKSSTSSSKPKQLKRAGKTKKKARGFFSAL